MDPAAWTFVILAGAIIAFLSAKVPLEVVAVAVPIALWATGVLTLPEAFAGFGDPTVLFIASLFVVAAALDATGWTTVAGRAVVARAGDRRVHILLLIGVLVSILTAFISINGAVAALVPVVGVIAARASLPPSQLMIPLAFMGSAASLLTLTGTPVNVVVSELAAETAGRGFGYLEFALVGLPVLAVTVAVIVLLGPRLLPSHEPAPAPAPTERAEETMSLVPEVVRTGEIRLPRGRGRLPGTRLVGLQPGARRTLVIAVLMIVLLATGVVPPAIAGLLAAGAIVVTRVLDLDRLYRSVSWTTLILIGGMIPLSGAFLDTGAADLVAQWVRGLVGDSAPHVALLVLCLVVMVLGQFISNVATVLIVAPVAGALAEGMGVSALPFLMGLTVAGAAAFLTPVATPANLMVMAPGGYRFGDYWRLGLPLMLVFLAAAVLYVPLVWPF